MTTAARDVVLLGPGAATVDVAALATRLGARSVEVRGADAVCLRDVAGDDGAAGFAASHRLDCAVVPSGRRLADFRLVAMDMDSTLITIECIDEIADMLSIKPAVAAITESAMRGEIAFPESLRRRVALLAGLPVDALARVYEERLRLSPGAEAMLAGARRAGLRTLLVSGGFTFFTERLKARLGLDDTHANVLEVVDGRLTGRVVGDVFDGAGKARVVRDTMAAHGFARDAVIVLGDGANDLPMMAEAGVSIAFRAKPVVRAQATHALDHAGLDALLGMFPPPA